MGQVNVAKLVSGALIIFMVMSYQPSIFLLRRVVSDASSLNPDEGGILWFLYYIQKHTAINFLGRINIDCCVMCTRIQLLIPELRSDVINV